MDHTTLHTLTPTLLSEITNEQATIYPNFSIEGKIFDNRYYIERLETDKEHIDSFGLNTNDLILQLKEACKALESAELIFKSNATEQEEAERTWHERKDNITKLLSEAHGRLNFIAHSQKRTDLFDDLQKIQQGTGYKDAIMDLGETHILTQKYATELATVNYSAEKIEDLQNEFTLLSEIYPKATAERTSRDENILLRNRAFWYLDSLEQYLKKAILPMVFWDSTEKRKLYHSPTAKDRNRKYRNKKGDRVIGE